MVLWVYRIQGLVESDRCIPLPLRVSWLLVSHAKITKPVKWLIYLLEVLDVSTIVFAISVLTAWGIESTKSL